MIILAIEATAQAASVCVARGEKAGFEILSLYSSNIKRTHSETLLPMIISCMENVGLSYDDIDLYATSSGPGSFTGVRIGAATLKGIAFGRSKPCVGVSSLHALAYNFADMYEGEYICSLMDARGNRYFTSLYQIREGVPHRLGDDEILTAERLNESLLSLHATVNLVGDGAEMFYRNYQDPSYRPAPQLLRYQNAASVALCAYRRYCSAENRSVFTDTALTPVYLLPSQAERERNKRKELLKNE